MLRSVFHASQSCPFKRKFYAQIFASQSHGHRPVLNVTEIQLLIVKKAAFLDTEFGVRLELLRK